MRALLLVFLTAFSVAPASPTGAAAQTPITADEFDAYATGKTLAYAQGNEIWGIEQYLPGRRVVWAFSADECQYGIWYPKDEEICFLYDNDTDPQCWTFFREGDGLKAKFSGGDGTELAEVAQSDEPLNCPGPDVGV